MNVVEIAVLAVLVSQIWFSLVGVSIQGLVSDNRHKSLARNSGVGGRYNPSIFRT